MPGPTELDESEKGLIAREVRKHIQYAVPHRAYVSRVYEHTKPGDPWNHEVDIILLSELADHNREFEVPVATDAAGDVALPNDIKRNFDLTERPGEVPEGLEADSGESEKQPTEKEDSAKPDANERNVDDRPECLVEYIGGDPDAPVVTDWIYTDESRAPESRVNDRYFTVGDAEFGIRADADDNQTVRLGFVAEEGDAIQPGIVITPDSVPKIIGPDGTDELAAAGSGSGGAGDGSGVLPDTDPSAPPAERAAQAGIDIQNTVNVSSSVGEIDAAPNTLYIVDGVELGHAGKHALGNVDNVAICGKNGASLKIPSGYRDFSVTVSGGSNFMWSGIDLDQTASGAYGRLNFNVANGGFYESFKTIGSGRHPDASPGSSYPGVSNGQGQLHIPATSPSGTVRMKNVSLIHGGLNPNSHQKSYPIGIFFGDGGHKGTLNVVDSQIEEFGNNGIYASACSGTVNVSGGRLYNNAVAQYRVANGAIENCTVGYDANNNGMANADASGHATVGIASEQKKGGSGGSVDVKNCTVEFKNVPKTRGAIATYDIHGTGHFGTIEGCEIVVDKGASGAAHIHIGGVCKTIADTTFGGTVSSGTCVVNQGPPISTSGLKNETSRGLGV